MELGDQSWDVKLSGRWGVFRNPSRDGWRRLPGRHQASHWSFPPLSTAELNCTKGRRLARWNWVTKVGTLSFLGGGGCFATQAGMVGAGCRADIRPVIGHFPLLALPS